jgi:hypothetical protein
MNHEDDLNEFKSKLERYSTEICPNWLTPNSTTVSIIPGHNLDLLQVSFDYRVDRTGLLISETPEELKDMSKPEFHVVREYPITDKTDRIGVIRAMVDRMTGK